MMGYSVSAEQGGTEEIRSSLFTSEVDSLDPR